MRNAVSNKEDMKQENRRRILSLIRGQAMSRVELAKSTGLTQSAVGTIVSDLLEENIVVEVGPQDDTALGRKPVIVDVNAGWGTIACVSIDHEGVEIGLTDIKNALISRKVTFSCDKPVTEILDRIALEVNLLIRENRIPFDRIIGVGVIVPGPVDASAGVILNPPAFEPWHGLNLKQELHNRLPYRIFVQHNANALTRAEYRIGVGSQYNSFALFVVNAGIGFGLVLNRQIYTGVNGLGCEIGHTSVDIDGRRCSCGNRGCLELYSSTAAVLYEAQRVRKDIVDWTDLVDKAWSGDEFCINLIDDQARYLAHCIINLNNLLELEAVVFGGLGAYRGELLLEKVQKHIHKRMLSKTVRSLNFEVSAITENALITAASTVVADKLFEENLYHAIISEGRNGSAESVAKIS